MRLFRVVEQRSHRRAAFDVGQPEGLPAPQHARPHLPAAQGLFQDQLVAHNVAPSPQGGVDVEHARARCRPDPGGFQRRVVPASWPVANRVVPAQALRSAAALRRNDTQFPCIRFRGGFAMVNQLLEALFGREKVPRQELVGIARPRHRHLDHLVDAPGVRAQHDDAI